MRKTRLIFWLAMLCCWLIQALAARHSLDADGVSYLNMADGCLKGNWHALVNGYWSPGYPFLLAVWLRIFHPSPFHIPLAVRLFAVLELVLCLAAFEYFLKAFLQFCDHHLAAKSGGPLFTSERLVRIAGYALFFWVTVFLTPAHLDQPDVLVFALYLAASGLCLQLVSAPTGAWWNCALLGMVLGLSFLAKAVMFPLSFIFFAGFLFYPSTRSSWRWLALSIAVFLVVSSPFILALSKSKGRFTYGDTGAINYRQMIGADSRTNESDDDTSSQPLAAAPHLETYTKILYLGTYPPWADPSFSYQPTPYRVSLGRQLNRIHVVLRSYFDLYVAQLGSLLCGLLVLLLVSNRPAQSLSLFAAQVVLWLPALAGMALYALVRAEPRFLAGFTVALFAAAIGAIRLDDNLRATKLASVVVGVVATLLTAQVFVSVGHDVPKLRASAPYPDWAVTSTLRGLGIGPGSRVSYMGDTLSFHVWAYLGDLSVAGEIPEEDVAGFWAAPREEQQRVIARLSKAGVKVLVTQNAPSTALKDGWQKVSDSDFYLLLIPKP